jgi:hypothetical protein
MLPEIVWRKEDGKDLFNLGRVWVEVSKKAEKKWEVRVLYMDWLSGIHKETLPTTVHTTQRDAFWAAEFRSDIQRLIRQETQRLRRQQVFIG